MLGRCHPLIWSLSRVRPTCPHVTSQAKNVALVGVLGTQMPFARKRIAEPEASELKASLIVNLAMTVPFHKTVSISSVTLSFWRQERRFSTRTNSQSLKALTKVGFQLPEPAEESQISATVACLFAAIPKREGKEILRAEVPH